jgi:hypothetical protein
MNEEIDFDLTAEQWETLRALRAPLSKPPALRRFALDDLVKIGLATVRDGVPAITARGRKVLIRGSSKLLDVAA